MEYGPWIRAKRGNGSGIILVYEVVTCTLLVSASDSPLILYSVSHTKPTYASKTAKIVVVTCLSRPHAFSPGPIFVAFSLAQVPLILLSTATCMSWGSASPLHLHLPGVFQSLFSRSVINLNCQFQNGVDLKSGRDRERKREKEKEKEEGDRYKTWGSPQPLPAHLHVCVASRGVCSLQLRGSFFCRKCCVVVWHHGINNE